LVFSVIFFQWANAGAIIFSQLSIVIRRWFAWGKYLGTFTLVSRGKMFAVPRLRYVPWHSNPDTPHRVLPTAPYGHVHGDNINYI
jgi:hypothetical protein